MYRMAEIQSRWRRPSIEIYRKGDLIGLYYTEDGRRDQDDIYRQEEDLYRDLWS